MQQLMRQQRINNIALTVGLSLILALHPWSGLTPTRAQVDPNATVPASFTDSLLFTVDSATALTRTPDGRLLIASKGGELRVLPSGSSTPITALTLNSETCDHTLPRSHATARRAQAGGVGREVSGVGAGGDIDGSEWVNGRERVNG